MADLAQRLQLLHRSCKLLSPNFHFPFKIGVALLELAGHVIELIRERLELVTGLNRNALLQLALSDALGACTKRLDRNHHPPRQEHTGECRQKQRPEQEEG